MKRLFSRISGSRERFRKNLRELFKETWRIITTCKMLWVVYAPFVLLSSWMDKLKYLVSIHMDNIPLVYSYDFLVAILFIGAYISMVSLPYVVASCVKGEVTRFEELWTNLKSSFFRLLGYVFSCGLILGIVLIVLTAIVFYPSHPGYLELKDWQSFLKAFSTKYILIPIFGAIIEFSIAGVVIHKLNGLKAFANSILISIDSFLIIFTFSTFYTTLSSMLRTIFLIINGEPFSILEVFIGFKAYPANLYLQVVESFFQIIPTLFFSIAAVLIYLFATRRTQYPWIDSSTSVSIK